MSVLRDIRNEEAFKSFSYSLLNRLRSEKKLSLQTLQNHIAIALGARDLNTFIALSRQVKESPVSKTSFDVYWEKAKATWAVIVIDGADGLPRFLHGNIFSKNNASRTLPVLNHVKELESLPAECDRFFSPILGHLVIIDGTLSSLNEVKLSAVNEGARVALMNDICPEFFDLVMAGEEDIESVLYNEDKPLVELVCQLGMTRAEWDFERDQCDTVLSYSHWVAHQLESWLDDITSHLK